MGCYLRERRGHTTSGACEACGIADARVLRRHRLSEGFVTLCANDSAIAGRTAVSFASLAKVFPSIERRRDERRSSAHRAADDRRAGERRNSAA